MQKKTWTRSDLWPVVAVLFLVAVVLVGFVAWDAGDGSAGAKGAAVAAALAAALAVTLGLIDRSEAMRREEVFRTPSLGDSQRWAARLSEELEAETWRESELNPANSDRARRALKGKHDIG